MAQIPTVKMNDGYMMPMLAYGLGTANKDGKDEEIVPVTLAALEKGLYHLDGAEAYGNETGMGAAIKASGIPREKLFIVTKVTGLPGQDLQAAITASLEKLALDYVDLYLIHMPFLAPTEMSSMWTQMEAIQAAGKARSIGVSNFSRTHLEALLQTAKTVPAVNQVEYHPYLQHEDLLPFCREKGIVLTGYSPLTALRGGRPGPVDDVYAELARKYGVGEADVTLRWCVDQGVVAITTSKSADRLRGFVENLNTFRLTPEEVARVAELGRGKHYRTWHNDFIAADDKA